MKDRGTRTPRLTRPELGAGWPDGGGPGATVGSVPSLAERLGEVEGLSAAALEQEAFGVAMTALARLRRPVDDFFNKVTVNCDDPALRANRLRLLSQIRATLNRDGPGRRAA